MGFPICLIGCLSGFLRLARLDRLFIIATRVARWKGWGNAVEDVTRRVIFYVPGFDPFPFRRYRELYRAEAQRQAALAGYQISQLPPDPALGADCDGLIFFVG